MLQVENLTKKYTKTLANDDVSFTVDPGEICVLAGPNGAGKSTAIKCVVGLLRFSGRILIGGHGNKTVEAKRLLGYAPEFPALYTLLTVDEHLEFIARAYKLEAGWEERANTLLERFELADKRDKLGKELSKGMQQKVSLCCALLPEPKVLMLDEPLVGLDPHAIKELKAMLLELKASGCSVIISTHMLESVDNLCDSVLIMTSGRIARRILRSEIEEENLLNLFFEITEGDRRAK